MKKILLLFIFFLNGIVEFHAANRFWIATSPSNWNNTANWSLTSGGSGGASIPAVSDIAVFDMAASGNCNITATISITGITINGYNGTINQGANFIIIGATGFTQNSGVFAGGSSNITINQGDFNLNGGVFTSCSASLIVGGAHALANAVFFTHSAGIFNHNNGTVVFTPYASSCTSYIFSVDVLPTTLFYDVEVNQLSTCGINHKLSTTNGNILRAAHNFTHTQGALTGLFSLGNALTVKATAGGGSGTITFTGTGTQTYFQSAGTPRTCRIEVNKTSGSVMPLAGVSDFSTEGFTLVQGNFTAPPGNFSIGGSSGSRVIFDHQSGTFFHNNGKMLFNIAGNSCSTSTFSVDVLPSTLFYDMEISIGPSCGISHVLSTGSGDILNVQHDLIHTDGVINGQISLDNDLIINAAADGGAGTITFDGTGTQTYFQAAGAPRTCRIAVNKTSGAVTPLAGVSDFSTEGFTLVQGDFTAPPGNFSIGGSSGTRVIFDHQSGTFAHNNGKMRFNIAGNSCSTSTFSVDVLPSTFFYDMEISVGPSCGISHVLSTASGDILNVLHDLVHTDGVINGQISLDNDLIINATSDGGAGTITFDGAGTQTYFQAAGAPRTCRIAVNKTSGVVIPAGGMNNFSTEGFTLLQGDFTAPTGNFSIGGSSGTRVIFDHQSGTFAHNNGKMLFNIAGNSCSTSTFSVDVLLSTLFYDMEISVGPSCGISHVLNTASGDVLNVLHDLIHTDGVMNGQASLDNNLIINATADGGAGTITFDGAGTQTYFQAAGAPRTCRIAVNKTSGVVIPAGGMNNFSTEGFTLLQGDFTAPTGNFSIGGSSGNRVIFDHQSGTFSHNNGKMLFNIAGNSCSTSTFSVDVLLSTLFYDMEISVGPSCGISHVLNTASGDVLNVLHDLIHTDGVMNGQASLDNDLIINATADGGIGTITFDGAGTQTYFQATGASRTCKIAVNKISGVVSPSVGVSDFSTQGFNLVQGNFMSPTGNFSIGGSMGAGHILFNHQGGVFLHNNGKIIFEPTSNICTTTTFSLDLLVTTSFYDVELNVKPNGCGNHILATAPNDTMMVANILRYAEGLSNAQIEAKGDVIVLPAFDGGGGKLVFAGTNAQTFDLTSATSLFNGTIVLNKSTASSSVTLLSDCILDAGSTQSIIFNKGILVSDAARLLTIGNAVTVMGANDSSYVNGPVQKTGKQAFVFPTGKEKSNGKKYYRPIQISAPVNVTDGFTAEYFRDNPSSNYTVSSKDVSLEKISTCEYWILNRSAGSSNASVTLSWKDSTSCGVNVLPELRVARWDGSAWKDHGNGGYLGTTSSGSLVSSGVVIAFSPFTLASSTGNNPLPVELISFSGACNNNLLDLEWITASEHNNAYFAIEQSDDGLNWIEIARLEGTGNSKKVKKYKHSMLYNDSKLFYYRLKQADKGNLFSYSDIITGKCDSELRPAEVKIYPNPSKGLFNLIFTGQVVKHYQYTVYNSLGQIIYRSINNPEINLTNENDGMYILHINIDGFLLTQKIIKN